MKTNTNSTTMLIPMSAIEANSYNARKSFDAETIKELAQSISIHGLIQPITVRKRGEKYEVVCGERRFRACQSLKMTEISAIVREATDEEAYDLSISENLQREDVPPMEAAEAYKRLIDTKRYDVASLALQFGKSEKHVYQTLKLCELIPGIAALVRTGKLTASAGVVISKYDPKIQESILKDRMGENGSGEWCHLSAAALENRIQSIYTDNLADYSFDKTACQKCAHNSAVYDMFACGSDCGKCSNKKCLDSKQTAHLVTEVKKMAKADPKMSFIGTSYGYKSNGYDATAKMSNAGHEIKSVNTYSLERFPSVPTAPVVSNYKKPEDFNKAQAFFDREQEKYTKRIAELDALRNAGKIQVYARIGDSGIERYFKKVETKDTKTNAQLIADWTEKKKRNDEIACEKTAADIRELLKNEPLPQSAFTADEEVMVYYFMLSKLRRENYTAVGFTEKDSFGIVSGERKLAVASALSEEQKTIVRRDFLHSHLTDGTSTTSSTQGNLMMKFAKLHLPEQTKVIETAYKDEYAKKNARLDERIEELKKLEKPAKPDQSAQPSKNDANVTKPGKAVKAIPAKTDTKEIVQPKALPAKAA